MNGGETMSYRKVVGNTPAGGDYSEIYYFDSEGNKTDEKNASKCIIRECKFDGTLLKETYGHCGQHKE